MEKIVIPEFTMPEIKFDLPPITLPLDINLPPIIFGPPLLVEEEFEFLRRTPLIQDSLRYLDEKVNGGHWPKMDKKEYLIGIVRSLSDKELRGLLLDKLYRLREEEISKIYLDQFVVVEL